MDRLSRFPGSRCPQDLQPFHLYPGVRDSHRLGSIHRMRHAHLDAEDGVPILEQQGIGLQAIRGCFLHLDLVEIKIREGQPRLAGA